MVKHQFLENVFIEQQEKVPIKLWDDEDFVWNVGSEAGGEGEFYRYSDSY